MALLGDSAHAMQPNLGQGGCMAIEDGYLLATDLAGAQQGAQGRGRPLDVERVLQGYQVGRRGGPLAQTLVHAYMSLPGWASYAAVNAQCLRTDPALHFQRPDICLPCNCVPYVQACAWAHLNSQLTSRNVPCWFRHVSVAEMLICHV